MIYMFCPRYQSTLRTYLFEKVLTNGVQCMETYMVHPDAVMISQFYDGMI